MLHHEFNTLRQGLRGCRERVRDGLRLWRAMRLQAAGRLLHLLGDAVRQLAAVAQGFATDQVIRLYGGCAFINGQDFGVAQVLGRARFFDIAHAAVYLHAQLRHF